MNYNVIISILSVFAAPVSNSCCYTTGRSNRAVWLNTGSVSKRMQSSVSDTDICSSRTANVSNQYSIMSCSSPTKCKMFTEIHTMEKISVWLDYRTLTKIGLSDKIDGPCKNRMTTKN